jgi:hypothetical protein
MPLDAVCFHWIDTGLLRLCSAIDLCCAVLRLTDVYRANESKFLADLRSRGCLAHRIRVRFEVRRWRLPGRE